MNTHDTRQHVPSEGRQRLALGAILLLGLALRLFRLGEGSIWYDEGVSLYLASLSVPSLIAHTAGDIHPPLYYMLLHLWLGVAGNSQFAAAFFSLSFGVLLIAATYLVARRLLGHPTALLAALLVALSPYHLWYSQEIRMYTLGALLGLLSFYFFLQRGRLGGGLAYIVVSALGLYTLYYFAFLLIFQNLVVLLLWLARRWRRAPRPHLSAWIVTQIAIVILYLPWLPTAVRQATEPPVPPWRSATGLWTILTESWTALALGQSVETGAVAAVLVLVAAVCAVAVIEKHRGGQSVLLLAYTFVPVLAIYLASFITPLYHVRYVFLYAPAFAIVLARGLRVVASFSRSLGALVLIIITLAGLRSAQAYFYDPAYAPDDHRAAVRFISERVRPGDAVLINAGYVYPTFVYYYKGDIAWRGRLADYARQNAPPSEGLVVLQTGSIGGGSQLGWGSPTSDFYGTTETETAAALEDVARRHERLWLLRIYDTVTDPQGFIRRYLDEHFLLLDDAGFSGSSSMRVQTYRTYRQARTTAPAIQHPMSASFDNRVRLLGYDGPGLLHAGEASYLTTYWQATEMSTDLRAFVSLADEAGRQWAHWDDVPGGRLYPTSRWADNEVVRQVWRLDVPVGTPAADYRLQIGLYDAGSGARLNVLDGAGRSMGAVAVLGVVRVGKARIPVDMASLPVQQRVDANLGGEVRLVGYNLPPRLVKPGETLDVTVFWQGIEPLHQDRVVFVQLLDRDGKLWAAWEGPPVAAWGAGEVIRDHYRLLVPADAPDGEIRLIIGIYRRSDGQRLAVERGWRRWLPGRADSVDLGMIRLAARERSFDIPAMQRQVAARLGDGAVLLGYDLLPDRRPVQLGRSEMLRLTLYWQGLAPMGVSYTVFAQLLGPENRLGGQHDSVPGEGALPTTSWVKGEVITDVHSVTVRADAVSGDYRLVVGLYDAASGMRLPAFVNGVRQADDMIVLETVQIR